MIQKKLVIASVSHFYLASDRQCDANRVDFIKNLIDFIDILVGTLTLVS